MSSLKHIPVRQCTVCRQRLPKRELLRIVRTPTGDVVVDHSGRAAGRGAYLCGKDDCRSMAALRKGALDRALDLTAPLPRERYESLILEVRGAPPSR